MVNFARCLVLRTRNLEDKCARCRILITFWVMFVCVVRTQHYHHSNCLAEINPRSDREKKLGTLAIGLHKTA